LIVGAGVGAFEIIFPAFFWGGLWVGGGGCDGVVLGSFGGVLAIAILRGRFGSVPVKSWDHPNSFPSWE
jgi:hypothetical protein